MKTLLTTQSRTFVEKAQFEAESAPVQAGDPTANELLAATRAHIYFWPRNFSGFRCQLTIEGSGGNWSARLEAPCARRFSFKEVQGSAELTKWAHYQVGEILGHRQHPSESQMASKSGVTFGDRDPIYGQRLDFVGDKMASFYRVKHDKISQIGRTYGGQSFVINIDRHLQIGDRFVASNYTAFYTTPDERLAKVEVYQDDYVELAPQLFIPSERRFGVAQECQREHNLLRFSQVRMFENQGR